MTKLYIKGILKSGNKFYEELDTEFRDIGDDKNVFCVIEPNNEHESMTVKKFTENIGAIIRYNAPPVFQIGESYIVTSEVAVIKFGTKFTNDNGVNRESI